MKLNGIYIDLTNKEQVDWWNKIGRRFVRVISYSEIVEAATNKSVGVTIQLRGMFKGYVIKKNNSFLRNPTMLVRIDTKD